MDEIFDIWPTAAEMARDLGVPYPTVAAWRLRGIPASRHADIIEAAALRGVEITFERLHHLLREMRSANKGAA